MSPAVHPTLRVSVAPWPSPTASADGAVADYSRAVDAELAVVEPDANRDDVDATGHRVTELRPERAVA